MNRWLGIILCLVIFAGCKKTEDVAANVKNQAAIDDKALVTFINANNLSKVAVQVGSPKTDTIGVYYIIEDPGTIPALYTTSTSVTVNYTASVITGTTEQAPFTSTADFNPSYVLGATIKGWQLGIQAAKINKGGKIRLLMSSRYAYGPYPQKEYGYYDAAQTQYKLPANAILDFEITILDVTN